MPAAPRPQPITRQIYFYQMSDISDLWHGESMPNFNPSLLALDLANLNDSARYVSVNEEYELYLIYDSDDCFRFGKARTADMATVEADGLVRPLVLEHGKKLFDRIHMVFFPSGVVGAEFNLYGQKMPQLTDYLVSRLTSCKPVVFDRLVHEDVMKRLEHLSEVKLIEMRIDPERAEVLAPFGDGWIETSKWMHHKFGVGSLEISLRAGNTAHKPLLKEALDAVREMFSGPKIKEATDKFRINAVPDGQNITMSIDLLDDKLMNTVEIQRHVYRNPDRYKELMFDRIRRTYAALEQEIMQAAKVKVPV